MGMCEAHKVIQVLAEKFWEKSIFVLKQVARACLRDAMACDPEETCVRSSMQQLLTDLAFTVCKVCQIYQGQLSGHMRCFSYVQRSGDPLFGVIRMYTRVVVLCRN